MRLSPSGSHRGTEGLGVRPHGHKGQEPLPSRG